MIAYGVATAAGAKTVCRCVTRNLCACQSGGWLHDRGSWLLQWRLNEKNSKQFNMKKMNCSWLAIVGVVDICDLE
jgi:hypothetical protein